MHRLDTAPPSVFARSAELRTPSTAAQKRQLVLGGLTLLALSLFGWALWLEQAPARAVRALDPEQRARLYQRTVEDLMAICERPVEDGLLEHCRQQRTFVALFPECRTECQDLLTRQTARFRPR